jgi:hypothetical protein
MDVSFDMHKMRKITVPVPCDTLEAARELTGEGISETVRMGLRFLVLEKKYPKRLTAELLELARNPLGPDL